MKKVTLLTSMFLAAMFMVGCEGKKVQPEELIHHRFVLTHFNGEEISPETNTELSFGERMTISGKMCNRFFGQATLEDSTLKGAGIAMTKMFCVDDKNKLNQLDMVISELLKNGAKVTLKDKTLVLEQGENKLTYVLKDLM